jgi:hypothetical protein
VVLFIRLKFFQHLNMAQGRGSFGINTCSKSKEGEHLELTWLEIKGYTKKYLESRWRDSWNLQPPRIARTLARRCLGGRIGSATLVSAALSMGTGSSSRRRRWCEPEARLDGGVDGNRMGMSRGLFVWVIFCSAAAVGLFWAAADRLGCAAAAPNAAASSSDRALTTKT